MTVKEVAEKLGYTTAKKSNVKYKGFDVYECVLDGPKGQNIGYPVYILAKDGKYRISDVDEALEIMGKENEE